jgi:hypothetical protein
MKRLLRGNCSKAVNVAEGPFASLPEQQLTGHTIHAIGLPETGHKPPASYAAEQPAGS